jgi:hypothetical protein
MQYYDPGSCIPDDLLLTLLSGSYSKIRGILAAQTVGTEYSKFLLLLVNVSEFKTMLNEFICAKLKFAVNRKIVKRLSILKILDTFAITARQ